jgi:hypothetical protein
MKNRSQLTEAIHPLRNLLNRSPWRRGFFLGPLVAAVAFVVAWFTLSPAVRAVSPPPDGGYPNQNTAEGDNALFSLTSGIGNTAIGNSALFDNTYGSDNTAVGYIALLTNTSGSSNTATGEAALLNNTSGSFNTASGLDALFDNTIGSGNTASGASALFSNTTGGTNTANGDDALSFNSSGSNNTAVGFVALQKNTTASNNTACGANALKANTGANNIGLGASAGVKLTTGSNNIDIGNTGVSSEANTIRIGVKGTQTETHIAGISGATVAGGVGVIIDTNGHLGTISSTARVKEAIKSMDRASEAILALKPVTFRYKREFDPAGIPQFGLVAEQVEKINPDLVARDDQGKPYTVRYEAVNTMLLNEFLKAHRKIEEQQVMILEQQKEMQAFAQTLQEQAAQLQKVSADRSEQSYTGVSRQPSLAPPDPAQ